MAHDQNSGPLAWINLAVAAIALVVSGASFWVSHRSVSTSTKLEVERKLAEAFDLLGGRAGVSILHGPATDPFKAEQARRLLQETDTLLPSYAKTYRYRAAYYRSVGKLDNAQADIRHAIELDPNVAAAQNALCVILLERKQPEPAIVACNTAIALDPQDAIPHYDLANVYTFQGNIEQAITEYRNATKLNPTYAMAYINLTPLLRKTRRFREALVAADAAVKLDPGNAVAANNRGNVLSDIGDRAAAIASFQRAVILNNAYALAHRNLGLEFRRTKQLAESERELRRALELEPNAATHNDLGVTLLYALRPSEAVDPLRRAHELEPLNSQICSNLATALISVGHSSEAEALLREAIRLDPGNVSARTNLERLLKQSNQVIDAPKYRRTHSRSRNRTSLREA